MRGLGFLILAKHKCAIFNSGCFQLLHIYFYVPSKLRILLQEHIDLGRQVPWQGADLPLRKKMKGRIKGKCKSPQRLNMYNLQNACVDSLCIVPKNQQCVNCAFMHCWFLRTDEFQDYFQKPGHLVAAKTSCEHNFGRSSIQQTC